MKLVLGVCAFYGEIAIGFETTASAERRLAIQRRTAQTRLAQDLLRSLPAKAIKDSVVANRISNDLRSSGDFSFSNYREMNFPEWEQHYSVIPDARSIELVDAPLIELCYKVLSSSDLQEAVKRLNRSRVFYLGFEVVELELGLVVTHSI